MRNRLSSINDCRPDSRPRVQLFRSWKFTLADALLFLIPIAFGVAYVAPWFNQRPIQWHRFSIEMLAEKRSDEQTVLILFKPALGILNDVAITRLNHPAIQRAFHSSQFAALDFEFDYAGPIPDADREEIQWLMNQPAYHKDAFAVLVFPDGRTQSVDVLDPNDLIETLALDSKTKIYLWLGLTSFLMLVGRIVFNRKPRSEMERSRDDGAGKKKEIQ